MVFYFHQQLLMQWKSQVLLEIQISHHFISSDVKVNVSTVQEERNDIYKNFWNEVIRRFFFWRNGQVFETNRNFTIVIVAWHCGGLGHHQQHRRMRRAETVGQPNLSSLRTARLFRQAPYRQHLAALLLQPRDVQKKVTGALFQSGVLVLFGHLTTPNRFRKKKILNISMHITEKTIFLKGI